MNINKYIVFKILIVSLFFCACGTKKHMYNATEKKSATDTTIVQQIPADTAQIIYITPNTESFEFIHPQTHYSVAFEELKAMLDDKQKPSFKRAVFVTENAYFENTLDYTNFCESITYLSEITKRWCKANPLKDYTFKDSTNVHLNAGIFYTLTDTIFSTQGTIVSLPYVYDFHVCFARENWLNMFVTNLLATNKGNCHSLPFLYKMIAEELGADVWLSFTPNHIYLRNRCKKTGWYNTEMTNASFPNEGWLMASGYVSVNSIVSGIYMDTLGLKQSIAVCVNDLAKGYTRKMENPDLDFVLQCCDLGLKYFPNYAELLFLKAETHLKLFKDYEDNYGLNVQNESHPQSKIVRYHLKEMEESYSLLAQYDYRELPAKMFNEWMEALENNAEKYQNNEIKTIFKPE